MHLTCYGSTLEHQHAHIHSWHRSHPGIGLHSILGPSQEAFQWIHMGRMGISLGGPESNKIELFDREPSVSDVTHTNLCHLLSLWFLIVKTINPSHWMEPLTHNHSGFWIVFIHWSSSIHPSLNNPNYPQPFNHDNHWPLTTIHSHQQPWTTMNNHEEPLTTILTTISNHYY